MKSKIQKILHSIRKHRGKILAGFAVLIIGSIGFIVAASRICQNAAKDKIFSSVESVPQSDVGLVLGTGKLTQHGNPNLHFNQRIGAAANLYFAGKVRALLVSGDNHIAGYDEPTDMRDALVAAGVPADKIICDYAGFRTLDSVVRAKIVFGLSRLTIITEEFHCPRAVWIAQRHGLDAVAFAAPDVQSRRWTWRVKAREQLARVACALDLYVLHRGPKFSGPKEPIILTASNL
jgi:SanA protein